MQAHMSENKQNLEVTIGEFIEELEQKAAPAAVDKIALNHNETFITISSDRSGLPIGHLRHKRRR